jgi:hypothetical protein
MEPAYKRYCSTYLAAFDSWEPVQSTAALHSILADVSGQLQAAPSFPSPAGGWTLDSFFILPYQRLRYYKKLYARLLKRCVACTICAPCAGLTRPFCSAFSSTQAGRSDHNLLIGANERLDILLEQVRGRLEMTVEDEGRTTTSTPAQQGERTSTVSSTANSRTSEWVVCRSASLAAAHSPDPSGNSAQPIRLQPERPRFVKLDLDVVQQPAAAVDVADQREGGTGARRSARVGSGPAAARAARDLDRRRAPTRPWPDDGSLYDEAEGECNPAGVT